MTKKNLGLKKVILGARWDVASIGQDFDRILDEEHNEKEICRFNLKENGSTVTSVIFAELYKISGEWQFKAIGEVKIADLNGVLALYQ